MGRLFGIINFNWSTFAKTFMNAEDIAYFGWIMITFGVIMMESFAVGLIVGGILLLAISVIKALISTIKQ